MPGPVGVTVTGARLGQEGSVTWALVHAGRPWTLTPGASPTHKAVALAAHTHTTAWACGVQTVHCKKKAAQAKINIHKRAKTQSQGYCLSLTNMNSVLKWHFLCFWNNALGRFLSAFPLGTSGIRNSPHSQQIFLTSGHERDFKTGK